MGRAAPICDAPEDPVDVTVVIPTRNRPEWLRCALASVLAQRGVRIQVVVVDDGSTPSVDIADPRIRVVRNSPSLGVAASRNRALGEVMTPWVAFLDDDDLWAPDHLRGLVALGCEHDADLVFARHVITDGAGGVRATSLPVTGEPLRQQLQRHNAIGPPACVLLRTSVVSSVGGFDTSLTILADWELWLRVAAVGTLAASPQLSVAYTLHGANMHSDADLALRELLALRDRHGAVGLLRSRLFDPRLSFWLAGAYRASGRRVPAALWYLRTYLGRREMRDLARAAGVILGDRAIGLYNARQAPVDRSQFSWIQALHADCSRYVLDEPANPGPRAPAAT